MATSKISKLANEKDELLNELGIKLRKKIFNLDNSLAFIEDNEHTQINIKNADFIGELDTSEADWQKLKINAKNKEFEFVTKQGKIISIQEKGSVESTE